MKLLCPQPGHFAGNALVAFILAHCEIAGDWQCGQSWVIYVSLRKIDPMWNDANQSIAVSEIYFQFKSSFRPDVAQSRKYRLIRL